MKHEIIIDGRLFHIGAATVMVQASFVSEDAKPHQLSIEATIGEVTRVETWKYSNEAIGNRDCDFAHYDEVRAEKFINGFNRFLQSKKGREFAE